MSSLRMNASLVLVALAAAGGCGDRLTGYAWGREPPAAVRAEAPPAEAEAGDLAAVVARVQRSVVSITNSQSPPDDDESDAHDHGKHKIADHRERAVGSGFVLSADGLVLTNFHVIEGASVVDVKLFDGHTHPATVVGRDPRLDVALVRVKGAGDLSPVALGSSEALRVGDPVIAIGNAFGLGPSVTRGIVSAKARTIGAGPYDCFLQTDAAINPGNSGGPLLDRAGRVVGINTAIAAHGSGVSFALPIDDVRPIISELAHTGKVVRGRLGVTFQSMSDGLSRALRTRGDDGALITEVEPSSPAAAAGVKPGDVVLRIDGAPIQRASDLSRELGRRKPGDTIKLEIIRDGVPRGVQARLDRLHDEDPPQERADRKPAASTVPRGTIGVRAADAPSGGAKVESVDPEGPAADELEAGDVIVEVNRREVRSAADMQSRVASAPRPSTVLLRFRRRDTFLYAAIDVR